MALTPIPNFPNPIPCDKLDVTSESGTVYATIDHSANSHSLFRGVGTGSSIGSHKIFRFFCVSEMCDKEVETCSENDLEEINERSVLIQTDRREMIQWRRKRPRDLQ